MRHFFNRLGFANTKTRSAFTLVEMLISVALVLMMMTLFSQIFTMAAQSMTLQRAIADNDQQVRTLTTILRGDLHKRTFRTLVPYAAAENTDYPTLPYSDRQGYFYLSLNDPNNATDNLLQFTVHSTIKTESGDESPYYGRATGLVQTDPVAPNPTDHVQRNWQQPEHDDGELVLNNAGASTAGEVCYYLRAGKLYRRVVLLRDPLGVGGSHTYQPSMTVDTSTNLPRGRSEATPIEYFRKNINTQTAPRLQTIGGNYLAVSTPDSVKYPLLRDDYWLDFDYAAYQGLFLDNSSGMPQLLPDGAKLIGPLELSNESDDPTTPSLGITRAPIQNGLVSTANPVACYRFGFDQLTGISREFSHPDPATAGFFFLGRYTLQEMSSPAFNFPQNASTLGGANPWSYVDVPSVTDTQPTAEPDGIVDALDAGIRRGEDMLLSNVHSFEVDVWDDRVGDFVQMGHERSAGGFIGDYHASRNQQLALGLRIVPGDQSAWNAPQYTQWQGRIFDTWHRKNDFDYNVITKSDAVPAPYRPLSFYPPGTIGPFLNKGKWLPNTAYAVGDRVFPDHHFPKDYSLYYVCVAAGTSGPSHGDWDGDGIVDVAETDSNMNGSLDPSEDLNGNGVMDAADIDTTPMDNVPDEDEPIWVTTAGGIVQPTPGSVEPRWLAVSNVRPLRAIRIRVRFLHLASGQMRQITLNHSLVD